jgi:hypothetical protein
MVGGIPKGSLTGALGLGLAAGTGLLRFTGEPNGEPNGGSSALAGTVSAGLAGCGSNGLPQDWQNRFLAGFTVWQVGQVITCASIFRAPLRHSLKEFCLKIGCDALTLHQRQKKSNLKHLPQPADLYV